MLHDSPTLEFSRPPVAREPGPPVLEVADLWVSYAGIRALSGISFVVPKGSVVALLGPNGAGKSTTLRAISGLVRPEKGSIRVGGVRVDGRAAHRIARLGVVHVPEGRGIFPSLSVRDNLEMAGFAAGDGNPGARRGTAQTVDEAVATFPVLGTRLRQIAGTLSGGEQQMLALARAVVCHPRLLLVDEISMGLAPIVVTELFETLRARAAAGENILLVEQYVNAALELADYVYVLDKGRIVDVGEPSDIRTGGLDSEYFGGA